MHKLFEKSYGGYANWFIIAKIAEMILGFIVHTFTLTMMKQAQQIKCTTHTHTKMTWN